MTVLPPLCPAAFENNNLPSVSVSSSVTDNLAADPAAKFPTLSHLVSVPSEVRTVPAPPKLPSPSFNSPTTCKSLIFIVAIVFDDGLYFKSASTFILSFPVEESTKVIK